MQNRAGLRLFEYMEVYQMYFTLSKQQQMVQKMYKETGDSKYRACPLIRKMVRGGNLGCKTGKGFYVYNADRTKTPVDQL